MTNCNTHTCLPAKALVFDMDGTLYHHPELNKRYNQSIYQMIADVKKTAISEAREIFQAAFKRSKQRLKREPSKLYVLNQLGISDQAWAKKHGRRVAPDQWLQKDVRLRKVLLHLQEYFKVGLVTNNHQRNTLATLKQLGIADCFDEIQTLSETRLFKPSSKLYRMICKKLNVDPWEAISIGDRYDLDLAPAAAIGMHTLLVSSMKDIYCLPTWLKPKIAEKIKVTSDNQTQVINKSSSLLKKGKLAVIPTDTVYGLAAMPEAGNITWIYRAKGRQEHNPIVLLIDHPEQAERFVKVSAKAKAIMANYWPGALTLVLPAKPGTAWGKITRGGKLIGIRCPDHDLCRKIIKRCNGALATTSANLSGQPAPDSVSRIDKKIMAFSELVIDGGKKNSGISSTVAKVVGNKVTILRQGEIKL